MRPYLEWIWAGKLLGVQTYTSKFSKKKICEVYFEIIFIC